MKTLPLLLTIILLTSGCSLYHVDSEEITTEFLPPKKSINDVVYIEEVDQPHEVIGYVTVNAERRQLMSEVMRQMKREAALMGGDAITNIQSDATGQWKKLPGQNTIGNAYVRANFTATVVAFKQ